MYSPPSNSRGSHSRPIRPRIDHPDHPSPLVSPTFLLQSPAGIPPPSFPTPFPASLYGHPTPSLSPNPPPNWRRPRATSSYSPESATLVVPEPHLHRANSARAIARPPSPPQTSGRDFGTSPVFTPALPHRKSVAGLRTQSTEYVGLGGQHDLSLDSVAGNVPASEQEWDRFVPPQALEALGKKEVERQSVLFEIFKSELDYVNDLQAIEDVYIAPILIAPHEIMTRERGSTFVSEVFWNLSEILVHHQRMLRSLFSRQRDQHPLVQSVADIILDNALLFTPEYESYIKHSPLSLERHEKELDQNPLYRDFIQTCSEDPRLNKRDFKTLFSRPITRLPRLKLILERIQKLTDADHPDLETIPIVLTVLQDFIKSSEPGIAAAEDKVKFGSLYKSLVDPQGEITDLDFHDDSRTLLHSGSLVRQKSDTRHSWSDVFGALLDNYFLLLKEDMSTSGTIKRHHTVRPIPLEYLQLASFDDPPEIRKGRANNGSFMSMSSTKQNMYPFTIYHANTSIARRYTLYTQTPTARAKWYRALVDAIGVRKATQDANKWYGPQTLNDGFFRLPSRTPFAPGTQFTGRAICAAPFPFHKRNYLAVGCTNGIYVGVRADSSFRKVLGFISPTSIVAIPAFNKFLVHCETALLSYPLDLVIRVSQGHADPEILGNCVERLAQKDGAVIFFKAGRGAHRTLVVYATKTFIHTTLHMLELVGQDERAQSLTDRIPSYHTFGSPIPIPRDAHDATFLSKNIAICASKSIHILTPMNVTISSPTVVPDFFDSTRGSSTSLHVLREKCSNAKILGLVRCKKDETLLVYDEFGCYIDQRGQPTRSAGYISWECRARAYAHRGPHLLLFSPRFIEVRSIASGKLVQVIEGRDVRLLHSGLTEEDMLIAAMTGDVEDESGLSEKVLELVPTTAIVATAPTLDVEQLWDEWDMYR
ncbi:hypothetical protein F5148DRAFT_1166295 [Russula earlei]|uniref:Uncharacterized protein n=1 Tax=Russula earlei TaxID=71964 RepID=A0ACC0UKJ5_9AGAM|nr:hypothetical protein F5148DRAFT_1166295 [Russula earlei]